MQSPLADPSVQANESGRSLPGEHLIIGLIAALAALAGRLALIRDFGTSLPYQDQWRFTAVDVLKPWLEGNLSFGFFFQSINDHVDALGRIYSFLLVLANGQWNNLLSSTLNAAFFGCAIFVLVGTVAPALSRFAALILALVSGLVFGLPHSWENTLFGIQIVLALEIVLSLCYMRTMTLAREFSAGWWLAQAAAGLVLLTQRSGVLVLAPVAALHCWRLLWGAERRRTDLAGLMLAGVWVAVFFLITPAFEETSSMKASSWRIVLDTILRQLGWPLPHPGWSLLVYLPFLWLMLDRIGRRSLSLIETFLVLVALWVAAHAVAIGYARGNVTTGFVSRYTDFLALGFLVNAACLLLLARSVTGFRARAGLALLAAAWVGFSGRGLWQETVGGHAGYNLERRLVMNGENLAAVRNYLATGEARFLEADNIRMSLYPHPPTVMELLAKPRFRALLPPETGAPEARADHGRLGAFLDPVLRFGPGFCAISAAALGCLLLFRRSPAGAPAPPPAPAQWPVREISTYAAVAAGLAWAGLLAWEKPMLFRAGDRWQGLLSAAGRGDTLPLEFTSTVGRPVRSGELLGAVTTESASARPFLHGTLLEGTNYTGIVCSPPFTVDRAFAVVLLTGWPNHPGNAVRWQVENPSTGEKSWLPALGRPEGPGNGLRLWTESLEAYRGWQARLFLFDGTADERGWVGISSPVLTDDPGFGPRWLALLDDERAEATHPVLAAGAILLSLVFLCLTLAGRPAARRKRRAVAAGGPDQTAT